MFIADGDLGSILQATSQRVSNLFECEMRGKSRSPGGLRAQRTKHGPPIEIESGVNLSI
jgi:hypothetical protein